MATMKFKLIKSPAGKPGKHKRTVKALGFNKVGQVVERNDTPQIRGMLKQIDYMIEIVD